MIQDGIDYGDGYERATEPGPDVERLAYYATGPFWIPRPNGDNFELEVKYRQPIKQKEKSMSEKRISIKIKDMYYGISIPPLNEYSITLSEAIRLGDEANRIMEEDKIKAGDWIIAGAKLMRCAGVEGNYLKSDHGDSYLVRPCKKITNPAHIQALTEIYEANK